MVGVAGQEVELQGLKVGALPGGQRSHRGQSSHGGQDANGDEHETDNNTGINTAAGNSCEEAGAIYVPTSV